MAATNGEKPRWNMGSDEFSLALEGHNSSRKTRRRFPAEQRRLHVRLHVRSSAGSQRTIVQRGRVGHGRAVDSGGRWSAAVDHPPSLQDQAGGALGAAPRKQAEGRRAISRTERPAGPIHQR